MVVKYSGRCLKPFEREKNAAWGSDAAWSAMTLNKRGMLLASAPVCVFNERGGHGCIWCRWTLDGL